jgi:phosphonate transport system substrate-binding protein
MRKHRVFRSLSKGQFVGDRLKNHLGGGIGLTKSLVKTAVKGASLLAVIAFVVGFFARPLPGATSKPVIWFGVIPRYNPLVMVKSYQPIMDYLTEVTPYRFELKLARNCVEALSLLENGDVQAASLGGLTFVEANRAFNVVPLVRPLNRDGEPHYRSIIVVRKDSDIHSVQDLKGRIFAFGSPHSTSGNLIPRFFLFWQGVKLSDLARYENLGKHDAVAKAVLKGRVDAGALKDVVAYRYRDHGLRFLAQSEPIPTVPVVAGSTTPQKVREALKTALLSLDRKNPQHRAVMTTWDPEFRNGFVAAGTEDYARVAELLDSIAHTCGEGCHR